MDNWNDLIEWVQSIVNTWTVMAGRNWIRGKCFLGTKQFRSKIFLIPLSNFGNFNKTFLDSN